MGAYVLQIALNIWGYPLTLIRVAAEDIPDGPQRRPVPGLKVTPPDTLGLRLRVRLSYLTVCPLPDLSGEAMPVRAERHIFLAAGSHPDAEIPHARGAHGGQDCGPIYSSEDFT